MISNVPTVVASQRLILSVLAAVLATALACDKKEEPEPGGSVRPGSRLGWNQSARSVAELRTMTYRLYVDDAPMSLASVQCNETLGTAGYECSGGLPSMSAGRHTLQLASISGGMESPRSQPLSITFGTASLTESVSLSLARDAQSETDAAPLCVSASTSPVCNPLHRVSTTLRGASSLTAIPDGRLLFVEQDSFVRVVVDGTIVPEVSLALDNPSSKIVGLAVDPSFENSRAVFVAWTSVSPRGVELNITRYRELQHILAEGALIVSGLPFEDGLRAPLVVDADGLLYVAMPSTAQESAKILRFTRDGFVPRSNPALSPAIGDGFARPADLALDVATGRLWVTGTDAARPYSVATFASVGELIQQGTPAPVLTRVDASDAPTLAVLRRSAQDAEASLLVARGGQLFRGEISAGAQTLHELRVEPHVPILSTAEGPAGSWYVLTGTTDGAQSLLQLRSP
jgi:glucose/sorbosone dehydrogenase